MVFLPILVLSITEYFDSLKKIQKEYLAYGQEDSGNFEDRLEKPEFKGDREHGT